MEGLHTLATFFTNILLHAHLHSKALAFGSQFLRGMLFSANNSKLYSFFF